MVFPIVMYGYEVRVAQSCPTLCDPMDYTVHGILQARILEWVQFPFSRGSSQPRNLNGGLLHCSRFFTNWTMKETDRFHMFFPIVMYGCKSWTIKKAECQRIDVFELWFWRRLLRVPWTARRWNQSILKEISPEYSLEGLMLKLKLQYFCYLMQRTESLGKTLMLGKIEGKRRRGQQRMRWLDGITNSIDMILSNLL